MPVLKLRPRSAMEPYQVVGSDFLAENPHGALWWKMGLGKTVAALTALADLFASMQIDRALVVGPKRVVSTSWPDEIATWEHTWDLPFTHITGTAAQREKLACQDTLIHLVSRDNLKWLVEFWGGKTPYDVLVLDEAQSFRNQSSKRWKAALIAASRANHVYELTGTPSPNGLEQIWAQVFLMDRGKRLGTSFKAFQQRYFDYSESTDKLQVKSFADEAIHRRVKDICFSLDTDDYVKLPPRIDRTVHVPLTLVERAAYKKLEREAILQHKDDEITAFNAGALQQKLLQYASGSLIVSAAGEKRRYALVHNAKIEALKEIVEDAAGEQVLVAYGYRSDLFRLCEAFPDAKRIDTPESIAAWNRKEIPVGLLHPQSGGVGLNLQAGGCILVWFSLTWDLEMYQQLNARLHRRGQECPVIIHHLIAEGTIDEVVISVLPGKAATQDDLLRATQRYIAKAA